MHNRKSVLSNVFKDKGVNCPDENLTLIIESLSDISHVDKILYYVYYKGYNVREASKEIGVFKAVIVSAIGKIDNIINKCLKKECVKMLEKVLKDLKHYYKLESTLGKLDKAIESMSDDEVSILTMGNSSFDANKYMALHYHKILNKLYNMLKDKDSKNELVTYYTVQELKAFKELIDKGTLSNNTGSILCEDYKEAYDWMQEQMNKRLHASSSDYPIWLWKSYINVCIPADKEYVVLEVQLPKDKVLESSYDAWHVILNDGTFNCLDDGIDKETQHEDWELLFDKDYLTENSFLLDDADIQAVTPYISINDIKVLKYVIE